MKTPKGQINRAGRVAFGDATISVLEEGISAARATGGYEGVKAWELQFKRQVFARIAQTLRRIGWDCAMPPIDPHGVKHYGGDVARYAAQRKRDCSKGDLKGELSMSGRSIEFKMWQSVNTPTRPDHGGRYESDLEGCMPYVIRLEMERTRRRIRDYLCNVFSGYAFDQKHYTSYSKKGRTGFFGLTALEWLQRRYDESCHIKGDPINYKICDYNNKSKDGGRLKHGTPVWFADSKGRLCAGTAYVNINSMWWVVSGKYSVTNKSCSELLASKPDHMQVKRNAKQRRNALEGLMKKAIQAMKFERAAQLRDLLFPEGGQVFHIYHKDHAALFGPDYRGYTQDSAKAGLYTRAELKPYFNGAMETTDLKAIEVTA